MLNCGIVNRTFGAVVFIALLFCASSNAFAQTRLLRFPDISGDRTVFTYGGDLWTAPASGGAAIRLTSHPGMEVFAKFSPDGKWIAFTGQYDGDEQVYVVSAGGGAPRLFREDQLGDSSTRAGSKGNGRTTRSAEGCEAQGVKAGPYESFPGTAVVVRVIRA